MVDFDNAFQWKSTERLDQMWAIMSAIGLWVNVEDISQIISMYHTNLSQRCLVTLKRRRRRCEKNLRTY
jgi:hypothetical protein